MEYQPGSVLAGVGGLAVGQTLTNCRDAAAEKLQQEAEFLGTFCFVLLRENLLELHDSASSLRTCKVQLNTQRLCKSNFQVGMYCCAV